MTGNEWMNEQSANFLNVDIQKSYFCGLTGKAIRVKPYKFSAKGLAIISPVKFNLGQQVILQITNKDHCLKHIPGMIVNTTASTYEYSYGLVFTLNDLPSSITHGIKAILDKLEGDTKAQHVAA